MCIRKANDLPAFTMRTIHARSQSERPCRESVPASNWLSPTGPGAVVKKRSENTRGVKKDEPDYTTRNSGTTSAGCLTTDSAGNLSLRKNALDIVLFQRKRQGDYLRRLRRSTISRYRSGSRRLR